MTVNLNGLKESDFALFLFFCLNNHCQRREKMLVS